MYGIVSEMDYLPARRCKVIQRFNGYKFAVAAMPKYSTEDTPEDTKPKTACSGLRDDLKDCLLKSDCVRKDGLTPKECLLLGNDPRFPTQCMGLRTAFFECKRSILDMRTRFRGRKGY